MHETDGHARFATPHVFAGRHARVRILADVLAHLRQEIEGLVFTEQLHHGGQRVIRGARGIRVGHLDLALVGGLDEVFPALGRRQVFLLQHVFVIGQAQDADVDADGAVLGRLGLLHGPRLQLGQGGRFVFFRVTLGGGLQVRIARAAPPDVRFRVRRFGADLRVGFPRALPDHRHLDLAFRLEAGLHQLAPFHVGRTQHGQALLGGHGRHRHGQAYSNHNIAHLHRLTPSLLFWGTSDGTAILRCHCPGMCFFAACTALHTCAHLTTSRF